MRWITSKGGKHIDPYKRVTCSIRGKFRYAYREFLSSGHSELVSAQLWKCKLKVLVHNGPIGNGYPLFVMVILSTVKV